MLRFVASPTGDMHIGTLRIAIFNYILSKQRNEDFIVRIEDMDKKKNIEGKDQEILDTLGLFGIEYSQLIYQNESVRFHSAMALQLVHERKAFSCFCSDDWLDKKHKEAQTQNKEYSYDDACRNLPAELVIDNTSPFRIRVTRPDEDVVLHDIIQGDTSFTPDEIDSLIILNQDKIPMQDFASGVNDMLSDISLIVSDAEQIKNSAKQAHIRTSLKYEKKVEYAHLTNIKDDENTSVKGLLEQGFLPEAILNYLISIQNEVPQETFTTSEAIEWFDLEKVSSSSVGFDVNRLRDINKKHLRALDAKELSRYVGFADAEIGELARIYLEEVSTTKELKKKIAPIFSERIVPEAFKEQTKKMKRVILNAPYFEQYTEFEKYVTKESGLKGEEYLKTLRILLINTQEGPHIAEIYKYLKNYIGEIVK